MLSKVFEIFQIPFIIVILLSSFAPKGLAEDREALFDKLKTNVYNFRQVESDIYRSGQLSKEAVPQLRELGIKTVISFDDHQKRIQKEKEFLKDSGIEFISIPWSASDYPQDEAIKKIHALMEAPENKPVLVHCKHGQERTGVVIATWRISHQGWGVEKAYQEMKFCGFRSFQYGHLKNYVYEFAAKSGQPAKIGILERIKIGTIYRIHQLRKLNPFK